MVYIFCGVIMMVIMVAAAAYGSVVHTIAALGVMLFAMLIPVTGKASRD